MARDCPTPKGEGKGMPQGKGGDFGKGGYKGVSQKGGPKGSPKGGGKGYFGKGDFGKGFRGECWSCGKKGHRADQCKGIQECTEEEVASEECAVEIGGIWNLACVECEPRIPTFNRFQDLEEEEEDLPGLVSESEDEGSGCFKSSQDEEKITKKKKKWIPVPRKKWKKFSGFENKQVSQPGGFSSQEKVSQPGGFSSQEKVSQPGGFSSQEKVSQLAGFDTAPGDLAYKGYYSQSEEDKDQVDVCVVEEKKVNLGLCFQVCNVKKALIAVKRICEKGNQVSFGPKEEDNYIQNLNTGDKIMMRPNGRGSYLMDVTFEGGKSTTITVDSGAEENVCPYEWGSQFGIHNADKWMSFRGANGSPIEHYGKRNVKVSSTSF